MHVEEAATWHVGPTLVQQMVKLRFAAHACMVIWSGNRISQSLAADRLPGRMSVPRHRGQNRARRLLISVSILLIAALLVLNLITSIRISGRCCSGHAGPPLLGADVPSGISHDAKTRKLAVIIPYRDREEQLRQMLPITIACLQRSHANFSIFVLEQTPGLHFNRGALLNVGATLMERSDYECLVFHDVDTVCGLHETVMYRCPAGNAPLHLTPPGLHPRDNYPEFVGGNIVFTREQFLRVNGFHHSFWGWGKEDNNMVRRLQLHGMWPPEHPKVPPQPQLDYYWQHLDHPRPQGIKIKEHAVRDREAYANLEPRVHDDNRSGLSETQFWVRSIEPFMNATRVLVDLHCDRKLTAWCDQGVATAASARK